MSEMASRDNARSLSSALKWLDAFVRAIAVIHLVLGALIICDWLRTGKYEFDLPTASVLVPILAGIYAVLWARPSSAKPADRDSSRDEPNG